MQPPPTANLLKPQPANNYGSMIRTENPFDQGFLRQAAATPTAYSGPNQSRSAFARALADESSSQTYNKFNLAGQKFQQEAIESRAKDVQSRRENTTKQQALDAEKAVALKQQNTNYEQQRKDIAAYIARSKQDYRTNTLNNYVSTFIGGGLLLAALPGTSKMFSGLMAKFGGGAATDAIATAGLATSPASLGTPVFGGGGLVGQYAPIMNAAPPLTGLRN